MSLRGAFKNLYSMRARRGSGGDGDASADNPLALKGGYRTSVGSVNQFTLWR